MQGSPKAAQRLFLSLIDLASRARKADDLAVLAFMAVNDTHELVPYRQSALWFSGKGVKALSGVVKVEANAPFALWLEQISEYLHQQMANAGVVDAGSLPEAVAAQWSEWLPEHLVWLPFESDHGIKSGGMLFARDISWSPTEIALLTEWVSSWAHAWNALHRVSGKASFWLRKLVSAPASMATQKQPARWRKRRYVIAAALLLICVFPIQLSVLAPAELVAANPSMIRSPLDGVLMAFHVRPNQYVNEGDPLFDFDEVLILSQLDVARSVLSSVEAEYRQVAQQAISDASAKALLAMLAGRIEERRSEAAFLQEQLQRAKVKAPRSGIALFDDPSEWIGRPVVIGERVMRIAAVDDIEIEAWLPIGDAIPLPENAPVSLYLNSTPLAPVRGALRYLAHDAVERADGMYAYRMRASVSGAIDHRIGLKGTARVGGRTVPLIYWVMRRPMAVIRTSLAL